jgi:hypothetical protein
MLKTLLVAAGLAALALPAAASAQAWGGGDYGRPGYGGGYGYGFAGYPQFRDEKAHIRAEIREGLNEGWLDRGQAGDFGRRLQWVQRREAREFQEHGWSLPDWDQQRIRASLDQIDRAIDEARDAGDEGDRF